MGGFYQKKHGLKGAHFIEKDLDQSRVKSYESCFEKRESGTKKRKRLIRLKGKSFYNSKTH